MNICEQLPVYNNTSFSTSILKSPTVEDCYLFQQQLQQTPKPLSNKKRNLYSYFDAVESTPSTNNVVVQVESPLSLLQKDKKTKYLFNNPEYEQQPQKNFYSLPSTTITKPFPLFSMNNLRLSP